jgi:hypothetical protein
MHPVLPHHSNPNLSNVSTSTIWSYCACLVHVWSLIATTCTAVVTGLLGILSTVLCTVWAATETILKAFLDFLGGCRECCLANSMTNLGFAFVFFALALVIEECFFDAAQCLPLFLSAVPQLCIALATKATKLYLQRLQMQRAKENLVANKNNALIALLCIRGGHHGQNRQQVQGLIGNINDRFTTWKDASFADGQCRNDLEIAVREANWFLKDSLGIDLQFENTSSSSQQLQHLSS